MPRAETRTGETGSEFEPCFNHRRVPDLAIRVAAATPVTAFSSDQASAVVYPIAWLILNGRLPLR
jgi:hypothetical protein